MLGKSTSINIVNQLLVDHFELKMYQLATYMEQVCRLAGILSQNQSRSFSKGPKTGDLFFGFRRFFSAYGVSFFIFDGVCCQLWGLSMILEGVFDPSEQSSRFLLGGGGGVSSYFEWIFSNFRDVLLFWPQVVAIPCQQWSTPLPSIFNTVFRSFRIRYS